MAERERRTAPAQGGPNAAELLRAALEKIVFFEWRVAELAAELSAAQARCAAAELARGRAEDDARAADQRAKAARLQLAELEADRSRLAALLAVPSRGPLDSQALEAERERSARLAAELDDARHKLAANQAERERWLSEMIAQARTGDEAPAALAQFISELRGQILSLRDHQKQCEALLSQAGIAAPPFQQTPPAAPPAREPEPVAQARKLWAEGRLGGPADEARAVPAAHNAQLAAPPPRAGEGIAARALAEQCLRSLAAADAGRREQAARHLAAVPSALAAPALATALGAEQDPRARAQLARALAACGGEGAVDIVSRLQSAAEPALVRLAALEALGAIPSRARPAVEAAAADEAPAVRRRAAALAAAEGFEDLLARLALDGDASVRAACAAARREAPAPAPAPVAAAPPPRAPVETPRPAAPRAPAPEPAAAPASAVREVLKRLVLAGAEGGAR